MGKNIGYKRINQLAPDIPQLEDIELDQVFEDQANSKSASRPALDEALTLLKEGDILHVQSIDRLARNTVELQALLTGLIQRGIAIHFHTEDLVFSMENPQLLKVVKAVSSFEREITKERQIEGIEKAKAEGRHGRAPKLTPMQVREIKIRISRGESKTALATEFKVSRQTLYSSIKKTEA